MSKNRNPKKKQYIPACIFCKSTPVTEEHLWPHWIEKEFSKEGEDKHVVNNYQTLSHDGSRTQHSYRVLNRNIIRIVVKKFCAPCNNGWMSRIEAESKEIIKSLILDKPILLEGDEQSKLARWGILKSIIGEYADSKDVKIVISKEERLNFFQTNELSPNFKVYIGRSLAEQDIWKTTLFTHFTGYLNFQNFILFSPPKPNAQWSLFVKNTFVMIVSWSEKQLDLNLPPPVINKFVQIHPLTNISFSYDSILALSGVEMNYVRENLNKHSFAVVDK
jgi:hypothetical protein